LTVIPGLTGRPIQVDRERCGVRRIRDAAHFDTWARRFLQIALRVRAATEQVEVRDTTTGVEKERTEGSQVIAPEEIADLPISDRDFIDFVLLTPTATVGRDSSTAAQSAFQETVLEISFGGLRETHSVFYGLDGINYTTTVSGVQRVSPSLDWVQEFRVSLTGPTPRVAD
jgi:hypothetical protein